MGHRSILNALSQLPGGVWVTDRELRITYARGRAMRSAASAIGMTVADVVHADGPTDVAVANHLAALAGATRSFRYPIDSRLFDVVVEPLHDNGAVVGTVGVAIDVTEKHELAQRLQRAKLSMQEAQRVAHVGSFEWDVRTNRVTWTDELFRIYGLQRDELAGAFESFLARVHPDDALATKSALLEAVQERRKIAIDHRILREGGEVRTLHMCAAVTVGEDGCVDRLLGSSWDVTEHTRALHELERSVSLMRATLDSTADGILVIDESDHVVAYNARFLALWRIPEELVKRRDDRLLLSYVVDQLEDPEGFERKVRELYDHPPLDSFDVLRFKDGRVFERYSTPQRVGDRITGRAWSFRDVTQREQLLERAEFLAQATRVLSSLDLELAFEAVLRLSMPTLGHSAAVDMLAEGAPRRLLSVSLPPGEPIRDGIHPSVLAGQTTTYSAGQLTLVSVPLLTQSKLAGVMTFARVNRDYTPHELELIVELAARMSLSLENARLYRRAQQAVRARDELLSIAAHEIRGPVTSIHLTAQSIKEGKVPPASMPRALALLEREDRRLRKLVDELLDLGQIRGGQFRLALEQVDLAQVVRDVVSRMSLEISRAGSALQLATSGRNVGEWDRLRLDQIVTNLLANALKFGRGKPIEVAVTAAGDASVLEVRDNGIGIPEEIHEKLFEPFEQAASARSFGGLGLGLYIVSTIVRALRGTITVESEVDVGSTFRVSLPKRVSS